MLEWTTSSATNDARVYIPSTRAPKLFALTFVSARYITGAGSGARRIQVGVFDSSDMQRYASVSSRVQKANRSWGYYGFSGAPYDHSNDDENWLPWPNVVVVKPGSYVRVWDVENARPETDSILRMIVQGEWA